MPAESLHILRNIIDFASTNKMTLLAKRKKKSIDLSVYKRARVSFLNTPYFLSVRVNVRETHANSRSFPSSSF